MAAVVVSIINLKGGVGKSTLTMILGEFLAFRYAKNVLIIDMDAQANLSYCMVPGLQIETQEREGRTTYHLFKRALQGEELDIRTFITQPPLVVSNIARSAMLHYGTDIHMVVSTPSVAQLDEELLQLWEEGKPMPGRIRQTLVEALAPALKQYDYVLIDCPPGLSLFSSAALIASDYYISPIIPEPLSLQGVGLVGQRVSQLKERHGARAEFKGVVLNMVMYYRNTHWRVSEGIYTAQRETYLPFRYWLPDNERLRKLGAFNPDLGGIWAMGEDHKFSDVSNKYYQSHPLRNPQAGVLSRRDQEGSNYRLLERLVRLVEEFQERCGSTA